MARRIDATVVFVVLSGIIVCGPHVFGDEGVDTGADDPVSKVKQSVTNGLTSLERSMPDGFKLAGLRLHEQNVLADARAGKISSEKKFDELYSIARSHWQARNYDDAIRMCLQIGDSAEDSKVSARAWYLLGKIMFGNRMQPATAIPAYENAKSILDGLAAKSRDAEVEKLRGIVLNELADAYNVTGQKEKAAAAYKALLDDPKASALVSSAVRLNANLELGRILDHADDPAALKYFENVRKIAESGDVPSPIAVGLLMEQVRKNWRDPRGKERIEALEAMWKNPKFVNEPRILTVGNELTFYYFFKERAPTKKFVEISDEFLNRAREFLKRSGSKALDQHGFDIYPLYGQNLLLSAEAHRRSGRTKEKERALAEFRSTFDERRFRILLPADNPLDYAKGVAAIYYSLIGKPKEPEKSREASRPLLDERGTLIDGD